MRTFFTAENTQEFFDDKTPFIHRAPPCNASFASVSIMMRIFLTAENTQEFFDDKTPFIHINVLLGQFTVVSIMTAQMRRTLK